MVVSSGGVLSWLRLQSIVEEDAVMVVIGGVIPAAPQLPLGTGRRGLEVPS